MGLLELYVSTEFLRFIMVYFDGILFGYISSIGGGIFLISLFEYCLSIYKDILLGFFE